MVAIVHLLLLACVLSAWASVDASDYFAVVAPNVIRFNHEETVSVSIFGSLRNKEVKVWLEHNGKMFSEKEVNVQDKDHPKTVTIKATEEDIFDKALVDRAKHVTLMATCAGYPVQSAQLLVNYHSGYLLVQTDKPLYTPGQAVNYRVLALDEGLNAATNVSLTIDIIFSTEGRAIFEVLKYTLPTFDVNVTVTEQCVVPTTTTLHVSVEGRYVYGKPVQGSVSLHINVSSNTRSDFALKMTATKLGHNGIYEFVVNMTKLYASSAIQSGNFTGNCPPLLCRLDIRADVFEQATGNVETGLAKVIFAQSPYIFKFDRSRKTYQPGQAYDLRVEVLHANGKALSNVEIEITKNVSGNAEIRKRNLDDGLVYTSFNTEDTSARKPDLTFKLNVNGVWSDEFRVSPLEGANQVKIEHYFTEDGKPQIIIASNMRAADHSGLTLMIIARGTIVHTEYFGVVKKLKYDIDSETYKLLSPYARAVAYYFDFKTNEVVSYSMVLYIEPPLCRGAGLSMSTDEDEYYPGDPGELTLTGVPFMDVRLNVIDKALLYLNSDNILHTDKMFKLLKRHDVGCGVGDGSSSSEILKNAGLVMLTNANLKNMRRDSLSCTGNRRKRAINEVCQANEICCEMGAKYGNKLVKEQKIKVELGLDDDEDLMTKCYSMALDLKKKRAPPIVCLSAYLRMCFYVVENEAAPEQVQGKSLDDESDYLSVIERLGLTEMRPRSNFQETWLFNDKATISGIGVYKQKFFLPDSITTWKMQAIGFYKDHGVCIANPVDIRGFKKFFLQLDMPYTAVRFEIASLKVTVFNYYKGTAMVNVYIEGVPDLCSSARPGFKSPRQAGEIEGNSAMTFTFHVRPLKIKNYDITVYALAEMKANQQDAVMRTLRVQGEGKTIIKTKHACLDPNREMKTCENDKGVKEERLRGTQDLEIKLERPPEAIPGTFFAVGYIKADLVADIVKTLINGTESLMEMPKGCGEQTMASLAPTVYAMAYVKEMKQITTAIETQGTDYIISGVERELTEFRQDDNSYGIYKWWPPSTWLTAFVMKVFCQAQKVIDHIDTGTYIVPSLQWLLNQQKNGMFFDDQPVWDRSMIGQLDEEDPSLTAFVIISFMECDGRTSVMNSTVNEAVKYLEDIYPAAYTNDVYLLAISTYALALADSPKKHQFMKMLQNKANVDGAKMYWGEPGGSPANAESVETTGYALLAYITFHYDYDSASIVRWLIQQRGGKGAFRTTMDTVVGLQALTEYSKRTELMDIDLEVSIPSGESVLDFTVKAGKINKVLIKDDATQLNVRVRGTGGAYLDIDYGYNVLQETRCPFNMSEIRIRNITDAHPIEPLLANAGLNSSGPNTYVRHYHIFLSDCDVCGFCANDTDPNNFDYDDSKQLELPVSSGSLTANGKSLNRRRRNAEQGDPKQATEYCVDFEISSEMKTGMAMVSFGLQTGVRVEQRDLDALVDSHAVARYEMPELGKSFVVFYVIELRPDPVRFKFRLIDEQADDAERRQAANVDIYEYYRPERSCNRFYDIYGKRKTPASYECMPGKKQNCVCLESVCASNYDSKLERAYRRANPRGRKRRRGGPAVALRDRICKDLKANYAVLVKMEKPIINPVNQHITVNATVMLSIHEGLEHFENGDKMTFRYKAFCKYPAIQAGQQYYVIARSNEKGVYELMKDAIVIKKLKRGILSKVMTGFKRLMRERGCAD